MAGATLTTIKFSGSNFKYLENAGFDPSINFSGGTSFEIILPRNLKKWSINNEILFSSYSFQGKYLDMENERNFTLSTTKIGYSYLKMNNLIRYKYPLKNIHIYINAGISNGFALSETNHRKKETTFCTISNVEDIVAIQGPRMYEQGIILGTGIKFNKFSFEFRYERGNGMSDFVTLNSVTNRYFFLLGYHLSNNK
ncbi:MAG: PorT family protein [Bacteroidales bacterium]|nr:PorT family protein [Bacteroidales bacterium]